jgi:spermidine/putrescine ABC transporter ATP-binding subunit
MAQVDLKNIVGRYGEFLAVDDVSLTIRSGAFVTLLGPSGCGKSSTLRIVAGLLKPDSGRVEFDGRDVTNLGAAKRNIGMVFQSLALFPHMTVAENVAFGLNMKRVPREDSRKQVQRMLEIVRLDHLAHRYPAQMSGGQQQRVALARALAISPSILILDEPFGALDRKLRETMQMELHDLTRNLGITALFVTHDQEEAMMLSDAVAVMNNGVVEQFGTPEEIYRSPQTQFVADFMGVTNFLPGKMMEVAGALSRVEVSRSILSVPVNKRFGAGHAVTLAVRPEKVKLAAEAPSADSLSSSGVVSGRVKQITYHGDASRYVVELEADKIIVAVEPSDGRERPLLLGTQVWASWRPEDVHLFSR